MRPLLASFVVLYQCRFLLPGTVVVSLCPRWLPGVVVVFLCYCRCEGMEDVVVTVFVASEPSGGMRVLLYPVIGLDDRHVVIISLRSGVVG